MTDFADDYISKPFSPREVVARVKAQLRRVEMLTGPRQAEGEHGLALDEARYEVGFGEAVLRPK